MPNRVLEVSVQCPYCWESFLLLVDASVEEQEYVEDCEICCRPIDFDIKIDEQGEAQVEARLQDE
ncbi:MAG: CPXCG motif-containing cysteine-rich protein [Gammaproteobacteria bacterium]|jgi:hypothetical protein